MLECWPMVCKDELACRLAPILCAVCLQAVQDVTNRDPLAELCHQLEGVSVVDPFPLQDALLPGACQAAAGLVPVNSSAVLAALLPLADVGAAIGVVILAESPHLVLVPLSLVDATIWVPHHAIASTQAVPVAAGVAALVGKDVNTLPAPAVVQIASVVDVTVVVHGLGTRVGAPAVVVPETLEGGSGGNVLCCFLPCLALNEHVHHTHTPVPVFGIRVVLHHAFLVLLLFRLLLFLVVLLLQVLPRDNVLLLHQDLQAFL
mmetsp:Transcript_6110/g.17038  ORF Transcript_6110/g.17038 Transcript_6110/m.17038 type:complete len:261 (-) Transcript_6110:952-1734(-)